MSRSSEVRASHSTGREVNETILTIITTNTAVSAMARAAPERARLAAPQKAKNREANDRGAPLGGQGKVQMDRDPTLTTVARRSHQSETGPAKSPRNPTIERQIQ